MTIQHDAPVLKEPREQGAAEQRFRELAQHAEISQALHESGEVKADAYLPVIFSQLSLPYKDPKSARTWERRNGKYRLIVQPGTIFDREGNAKLAYPYGSTARLFLIWLATEVKRKKVRELELGDTLAEFMRSLGFRHKGGNQRKRVEDQLSRLFSASITVMTHEKSADGSWGTSGQRIEVASSWQLWFSAEDKHGETPLTGSRVVIGEEFYKEIINSSIPLSRSVLGELQSHPMRMDIYVWMIHRLFNLRKEAHVSWAQLEAQFGGNYTRRRRFAVDFEENLRVVRMYYPLARVFTTANGLILRPSPQHLNSKGHATRFDSSAEIIKAATADS